MTENYNSSCDLNFADAYRIEETTGKLTEFPKGSTVMAKYEREKLVAKDL